MVAISRTSLVFQTSYAAFYLSVFCPLSSHLPVSHHCRWRGKIRRPNSRAPQRRGLLRFLQHPCAGIADPVRSTSLAEIVASTRLARKEPPGGTGDFVLTPANRCPGDGFNRRGAGTGDENDCWGPGISTSHALRITPLTMAGHRRPPC